jgi:hypothetical protein
MKFRKKPVVVEAVQFFSSELPLPIGVQVHEFWTDPADIGGRMKVKKFVVLTIHNHWTPVVDGDWIITEPDGIHHYPCKPDIFKNTYEPLDEQPLQEQDELWDKLKEIFSGITYCEDAEMYEESDKKLNTLKQTYTIIKK